MKKRKLTIFLISACIIGNLAGCTNIAGDKESNSDEKVGTSVDKDKKEDKKEDSGKDAENNNAEESTTNDEKVNPDKETSTANSKDAEDGEKENYYAKYDNFYNGTHALSIDFEGEGIGDNFLDYTFKINGKGNLSVEIASLRGVFKGDIDEIPNKFRQWKGTLSCQAEKTDMDVEVRITDHALVIIENIEGAKQTTKFYYESKSFDLEHVFETTYTKEGKFALKKK